jgi:hypothetical protein
MRRGALHALTGVAAVTLAGCFTTSADFVDDAEEYISTTVAIELGVEFTTVECTDPQSQAVGTRFVCTAIDSDDGTWTFDTKIDAKNEFTVTLDRSP